MRARQDGLYLPLLSADHLNRGEREYILPFPPRSRPEYKLELRNSRGDEGSSDEIREGPSGKYTIEKQEKK